MCFAVILNFFITSNFYNLAIFQGKRVLGVFQILILDQNPLEDFRVESKSSASF